MKLSPGFEIKGKEENVYKLHKAFYGLKQASRVWTKRLDKFFVQQGFNECSVDHGVYKTSLISMDRIYGNIKASSYAPSEVCY